MREDTKKTILFVLSTLLGIAIAVLAYRHQQAERARQAREETVAEAMAKLNRTSQLPRLEQMRDAAETDEERERLEREIRAEVNRIVMDMSRLNKAIETK